MIVGRRAVTGGLLAGMAALGFPGTSRAAPAGSGWAVYYADAEPARAFEPYGLLVLDSRTHPPLRPLKDRGKTLLGYISVGEVETQRPWFAKVKGWGILDQENPNWPGSFYVDVRDRRWVKLVVEELVPALLRDGFDGVFLDTLDNPPHLERTDPKRWAGMTEGAARLVLAIRANWPRIPIMQNRAYEILPRTARAITHALGESVYAGWDFAAKRPHLQSDEDYRFQVDALKAAKALNPQLGLYSLDYWDPDDLAGVRALYARQRANGFAPYVSVVELDRLVPEPPP
ncbi:endo alpha-1,4 polygalactosaminidase [Azospirillum doebereinerae]